MILVTFLLETAAKLDDKFLNNASHASGRSQDLNCVPGGLLVFGGRDLTRPVVAQTFPVTNQMGFPADWQKRSLWQEPIAKP
jgi:hypothetical protein